MNNRSIWVATLAVTVTAGALAQSAPTTGSESPKSAPPTGASNGPAPAVGEIVVYTQFMTSRRQSENLGTTVAAAMANPVIGPVLVVGAAYFGVPPEYVAALAASAAEAQQVKAEQNRQHRGDRDTFNFSAPDGYKICATRVAAISIHPTKKNRPKAVISGSTKSIVAYVDHSSQEWNAGRSTVKLRFDMLAVKNEAFSKYAERCLGDKVETLIPLCRGRDCAPAMNGSTWYNGQ